MGSTTTGLAVGLGIGIPVCVAILVLVYFFFKGKKRRDREDLEYNSSYIMKDINADISYETEDQLAMGRDAVSGSAVSDANGSNTSCFKSGETTSVSEDSDAVLQQQQQQQQTQPNYPQQQHNSSNSNTNKADKNKKRRFTPAYKQRIKSTYIATQSSTTTTSRNSSVSNLANLSPSKPPSVNLNESNSSIVSTSNHSNGTNFSSYNIPMNLNDQHSLSKALLQQQPPPLQPPVPIRQQSHNSLSSLTGQRFRTDQELPATDDQQQQKPYDLKNNYDVSDDFQITEEDQYVNEFTNYEENKRAYIEELRPK